MQEFVLRQDRCCIQVHLHDPILMDLANRRQILIPIHHLTAFHFTLLFINVTGKTCYHLNPMHRVHDATRNTCVAAATVIVSSSFVNHIIHQCILKQINNCVNQIKND